MENVIRSADTTESEVPAAHKWPLWKLILFRFGTLYLLCFGFLHYLPLDGLVKWTATHIFAIEKELMLRPTGSGDQTSDYIQYFVYFAISLIIAIVWSLIDRKRTHYKRLAWFTHVVGRFLLGYIMLSYGWHKIPEGQFPAPSFRRLLQPYGESSPMGLAWTFMGASYAYSMIAGIMEVLGGYLLFFRRTANAGAMLLMVVMGNVFLRNMCFDIPVKMFSFQLFLLAFFILLPDLKGILQTILRLKTVAAKPFEPYFQKKWLVVAGYLLKWGLIIWMSYTQISSNMDIIYRYGSKAPKPVLYGCYEVLCYYENGEEVLPIHGDEDTWRHLVFEYQGNAMVHTNAGTRVWYGAEVNPDEQFIVLKRMNETSHWNYSQPQPDRMTMEGVAPGKTFYVEMRRKDKSDFLLTNRGFNWINEVPFNR